MGVVVTSRLRTALFVPGDQPQRIAKAVGCATDAVVVDLEDAVSDIAKTRARETATETISHLSPARVRLLVRVNGPDTEWFDDDMCALAPVLSRIWAVVLPKATTADDVVTVDDRLARLRRAGDGNEGPGIMPIVETAAGVLAAREIAAASARVRTLLFGVADLSSELQVDSTAEGDELLHARSHVVLAAAAAGRDRPLDGPYLKLDDPQGLETSARHARRLGFGGKAVIHPAQLETVTAAFAPDGDEVRWAEAVDAAFTRAERAGQGSIRLDDGTFVDYPVARRARTILAEADAGGRS
jgi:citrate lyase subunit beta / citryl-CoA lyase